jgi:hypothetical protein
MMYLLYYNHRYAIRLSPAPNIYNCFALLTGHTYGYQRWIDVRISRISTTEYGRGAIRPLNHTYSRINRYKSLCHAITVY